MLQDDFNMYLEYLFSIPYNLSGKRKMRKSRNNRSNRGKSYRDAYMKQIVSNRAYEDTR